MYGPLACIHALFPDQLRSLSSRPFPRPFSDGVMVLVVGLVDKMKGLGELGESQCLTADDCVQVFEQTAVTVECKSISVAILFLAFFFVVTVLFSWNLRTTQPTQPKSPQFRAKENFEL